MNTGLFVTFEGGEGAGKTSLIVRLVDDLTKRGYDVVATREPGGIEIAEQIRRIILDRRHVTMDGRTEALLYAAARRQHLVEKVLPLLQQGRIVLCDRFVDSSLAYQGYARELGIDEVLQINQFAIDGKFPDITFLLDLEPQVGLDRIGANEQREVNRLDLEKLGFHRKVREGYRLLARKFPERIVVIDAGRPLEAVYRDVQEALTRRMARLQ